ncbi:hypothetical protein AMBLS11_18620 [Alteromonas macleodii str. 'Black Sea 11']|nr:hypothetical protein AMBLS11_18620 [Alteromonas macleodii str. 'Black Sea 11']
MACARKHDYLAPCKIKIKTEVSMLIKLVLVALVLYMIVNLFMAMRIMMKNDTSKGPMSKYIGRRVLTSAIIVIIILIAIGTGLITPNPRPY